MPWIWSEKKNRENRRKHKLSFETAQLVFNDPLHLSRPDPHPNEERWQTIGMVGGIAILVIHTELQGSFSREYQVGRIISARKATPYERKAYEEGNFD